MPSAIAMQDYCPPEALYPMLRAENAEMALQPGDLKYGALLVGGQGSGKTAGLETLYVNAIKRPETAVLVLDHKSEFARICLEDTWPHVGKRVWYLDLGHPGFGMNPLALVGDRPLAIEAAQIAENVVAALLDINPGQIYQSSRRYLYHAVIGAITLAHAEDRRAKLEDVYTLLRPAKEQFRAVVAEACGDQPDLEGTAEFFCSELPDDLRLSASRVAERLDPPRNKISGLTAVPPLRRFFNHPCEIPLREIIEARDILIVDANMGAIGTENAKACMMFILRMLHTQMQRQVHWAEDQRPRVALLIDEAHYIITGENVIDQIATHRAAGLEPAFAIQYIAQLGSGSEHQQKIIKGVLNLLQSRFLFRIGDPEEAEQATRIAMAVYSTMIRDDPDSRARLRVTPEQLLNFPNHFCLASWIDRGRRLPSFVGETYPLPDPDPVWADHHLKLQAERVGPYPEQLASTLDHHPSTPAGGGDDGERTYLNVPYDDKDVAKRLGARWGPDTQRWYVPAGVDPAAFATWQTAGYPASDPANEKAATNGHDTNHHHADGNAGNGNGTSGDGRRRVQILDSDWRPADRPQQAEQVPPPEPPQREAGVSYQPPPPPPKLDNSPVRQVVGQAADTPRHDPDAEAPDSLRELAYLDRINEIGAADQLPGAASLPRLYDADYTILALLDRAGLVPRTLIARAALPGRSANAVIDRLTKLYRHGLAAQHSVGLRERRRSDGTSPLLYSLTRRGMEVAQARQPPAISTKRQWRVLEGGRALRLAHDLHALGWAVELHHLVGEVATDHWRTPRYATGRFAVPQTGSGRGRHAIKANEIPVGDKQAIHDLELKTFAEIKPDLCLELRFNSIKQSFDLLVELDLTARPSYNHDKLVAYDAFLCGWSLAHPRCRAQGTRPVVVFVCSDAHAVLALAKEADETMRGRIGQLGTTPEHWYHAGRDHTFFCVEADLHHGDLTALALPAKPPGLRERLTGSRELELRRVVLLPDKLIRRERAAT